MISIYILTYNEEIDIAGCLDSVISLTDDIILVDSLSTDNTLAISESYAQNYPLRIYHHAFESHGKQRTWMLTEIPTKYDWVYFLDADERMTPELFAECIEATKKETATVYYVAERMMFMGKWIRYSTQYPRYQMRFFKKGFAFFDDYGHAQREICQGTIGFLTENYPHYSCSKGLTRWLEKHNRYSTDEAKETLKQLSQGEVNWRNLLFGKTELERRRALKDLSQRIPFRPFIRWLYMYFVLGGIRDGKAGFTWCTLQAFYEYLIILKVEELRQLTSEDQPQ